MEANRLRMRKAADERAEAGEGDLGPVLVEEPDRGRRLRLRVARSGPCSFRERPFCGHWAQRGLKRNPAGKEQLDVGRRT